MNQTPSLVHNNICYVLLFRIMFNLDQAPDFGWLKLYSNQTVFVVVIYDGNNRYIKQSKPVFYYFSTRNIYFSLWFSRWFKYLL